MSIKQLTHEIEELIVDGHLSPSDVVYFAKHNQNSELHKRFERNGLWDDKRAADIARVHFASQLIRKAKIRVRDSDNKVFPVRAIVSLSEERKGSMPSYSLRKDIITNDQRRQMMMRDCHRDIESLIRRYRDIMSADVIQWLQDASATVLSESTDEVEMIA